MQVQAIATSSNSVLERENQTSNKARLRRARLAGRRRRGRDGDATLSDDELERELGSDGSDSELSSLDSASDHMSESEAESEEDMPLNGRVRVETPDTTHSPPSAETTTVNDSSTFQESNTSGNTLLASNTDWSDMVEIAGINGDSSLPVIDFADMHHSDLNQSQFQSNSSAAPSKSAKIPQLESISSEDVPKEQSTSIPSPHRSRSFSSVPHRAAGQSAREVYQQRLQSDPSFVPVVGEFWGHDDRLLQKDLRSLSGWWRGRWQGRGRGRGVINSKGHAARGRGAVNGEHTSRREATPTSNMVESDSGQFSRQLEIPPVERAWTHDRYEESRVKEDRRRAAQQQTPRSWNRSQQSSVNGSYSGRHSNGPVHGKGSSRNQGGFSPSPVGRPNNAFTARARVNSDRPWFTMKPERAWTKQHDGFLHFDTTSNQKRGHITTIRVHLPGRPSAIAKLVLGLSSVKNAEIVVSSSEDYTEHVLVNLPRKLFVNPRSATVDRISISAPSEPVTTAEEWLLKESEDSKLVNAGPVSNTPGEATVFDISSSLNFFATPLVQNGEQVGAVVASTSGVFHLESKTESNRNFAMEQIPLPQTLYAPQSHPALQPYASPYPYVPHIPPGIAFNPQGVAYEIATGRPVYLHATPPPPISIYNSRPTAHSHGQFVPGHSPHMSSDFMAQSGSPNLNGFADPYTGVPLFSLPRQGTRVEIRAPLEDSNNDGNKNERRSSNLRSLTSKEQYQPQNIYSQSVPFMPNTVRKAIEVPFQEGTTNPIGREVRPEQRALESNAVQYPPYQQPYYYPEQYIDHYQYPPIYVDMPQTNGQYDTYTSDSQLTQSSYYTSS